MGGQLVAVKAISPERIEDSHVLKNVSPSVPLEYLFIDIPLCLRSAETVRQRRDMEAAQTPECHYFSRVSFRFSLLPCIPLDVQWEPVQVFARAPRC
jgi:hypothetical protein